MVSSPAVANARREPPLSPVLGLARSREILGRIPVGPHARARHRSAPLFSTPDTGWSFSDGAIEPRVIVYGSTSANDVENACGGSRPTRLGRPLLPAQPRDPGPRPALLAAIGVQSRRDASYSGTGALGCGPWRSVARNPCAVVPRVRERAIRGRLARVRGPSAKASDPRASARRGRPSRAKGREKKTHRASTRAGPNEAASARKAQRAGAR